MIIVMTMIMKFMKNFAMMMVMLIIIKYHRIYMSEYIIVNN